jgi:uncharacterized phage infection (PIP) family protein YhgE
MDIQDLNNQLDETLRTFRNGLERLEALTAKANELDESAANTFTFDFAIPRLKKASGQISEALQSLPDNFNG